MDDYLSVADLNQSRILSIIKTAIAMKNGEKDDVVTNPSYSVAWLYSVFQEPDL